ncbi:MAG: class I SAM-dependent methyltransferase, partial [Desulfovibrionaceae bacterium]|nr:class I SAM-dependent methyltransferase [Desulfovibrionaceae bacterium]
MFVWTDASRRWHLAAARACTYHDDLARALSPWIGPGDHAAELGCGLGLLALRLAGQAARVTAVDIDAPCLDLGRAERERAGIRNVDFQCRDALALAEDEVWDVVVACLFGNLAVNARYFLARARRCVLALVDTGGPKTSLVPEAARRRKPPAGEIALALERDGISFTRTDLAFE